MVSVGNSPVSKVYFTTSSGATMALSNIASCWSLQEMEKKLVLKEAEAESLRVQCTALAAGPCGGRPPAGVPSAGFQVATPPEQGGA